MKACSECNTRPDIARLEKRPAMIHPKYLRLECKVCKKCTDWIKHDYGVHGKGPGAREVLEKEWDDLNQK